MSQLSRRTLMRASGAAAVLAAAATPATPSPAAAAPAAAPNAAAPPAGGVTPWRVDTHHHAVPPVLLQWLLDRKILDPNHLPSWAKWELERTRQVMDANRIAVAVASAPVPSAYFPTPQLMRDVCRIANDSLAELVRNEPRRFRFFASVPLPHVDHALAEIRHAYDDLGADGVTLMAHAGTAYLGDPAFDPVFAELDRRRAVVFTHPFDLPGGAAAGVPEFIGDFMLDTTRAAVRMIFSGTLDRYPNVSIILSHGGGFLPYIGSRLSSARDVGEGVDPGVVRAALRRFHYDTAMPTSPYATPTLLAAVDPGRILFGTDWNARSADAVGELTVGVDRDPALNPALRRAICRDNARRLLPGVAAALR